VLRPPALPLIASQIRQQQQQPQRQAYQQDNPKLLDNKPFNNYKYHKPNNQNDRPAAYTAQPERYKDGDEWKKTADADHPLYFASGQHDWRDDVNNPEYDTHWVTVED